MKWRRSRCERRQTPWAGEQRRRYDELTPVLVGNLRSEILVVQPTQNRHRQRETHSLDGTRDRRVLVQRQVRPSLVVIFLVGIEQMAEMSFAEHNDMVKAIPSD